MGCMKSKQSENLSRGVERKIPSQAVRTKQTHNVKDPTSKTKKNIVSGQAIHRIVKSNTDHFLKIFSQNWFTWDSILHLTIAKARMWYLIHWTNQLINLPYFHLLTYFALTYFAFNIYYSGTNMYLGLIPPILYCELELWNGAYWTRVVLFIPV